MSNRTKKYYAVAIGKNPGIYHEWYGEGGAEAQVRGFPGARFKGFTTHSEAAKYLEAQSSPSISYRLPRRGEKKGKKAISQYRPSNGTVNIYTDGGCINNPGPGGYGIVIIRSGQRTELTGGYRLTTNNRMELMACIVGLQQLNSPSKVTLCSDSRYVVDGISKGWAQKWHDNNWMRNKRERAENTDLWQQLLDLCRDHTVEFDWVRGHSGNPENERCDQLAKQSALRPNLPPDTRYETLFPTRFVEG